MVNGNALHGQGCVHVHLWSGQCFHDHIEQGQHVPLIRTIRLKAREAVHGRCVYDVLHRELNLIVCRTQLHHQLNARFHGGLGIGTLSIHFVDYHHDAQPAGNGMPQHESRLGHRTLRRVDQQQRSIRHLQHALDLTTKICVARRVDDVYLHIVVGNRYVLRKNRNTALALLVVGVQHAFLHLLPLTKRARRAKHLVDQRRLPVVDMGDDGDIANVFLEHGHLLFMR